MRSVNYKDVKKGQEKILTLKTGNLVLDQFISDAEGFVAGSAIFLTGTPGAGKTTLSVVLQKLLENYRTSLYSREMSKEKVKAQTQKYNIDSVNAFIVDKNSCNSINEYITELDNLKPAVVIIDSLQIILSEDFVNSPPEISSFNMIQTLRAWTEKNNAVLIVIGHVNKDGTFEGKNTIEHLFDAHLEMIYNKSTGTRTLSWSKNRLGSIDQTLYYMFGKKTMEFYSKEQYQRIKEGKKLEDFVTEAILNYIQSLDKSSANYAEFKKELQSEVNVVMKSNISLSQAISKCVEIIHQETEKYSV